MGAANPYLAELIANATSASVSVRREIACDDQGLADEADLRRLGLLLCIGSSIFSIWLISRAVALLSAMF